MSPDRRSGRTTAEIADHNSRIVLETLRRSGPLTRNELATRLGLSIPGITDIAQRLLDDAVILKTKRRVGGTGMPSAQYTLDPDGAFAIGMRLSKGWARGVLVDIAGEVRARAVARDERELTRRLVEAVGGSPRVVGVGVIGESPLPAERLMVTPPLAAVLAQWSNDPVPAAQGIATVLIEERVRAGLFFHGRPFAGVHERAGRIGEMLTGNDRRPLDDVASAAAFRKLSLGQSARRHWVDEAATHLLDAIFALVGFLRPARVTVGGDLPAEVALALIERMLDISAAREPEATAPSLPPITYARYGKDAGPVGAALLPFFVYAASRPKVDASSVAALACCCCMSQVRSAPSRSLGVAGRPRLNSAAGAKLARLLIPTVSLASDEALNCLGQPVVHWCY